MGLSKGSFLSFDGMFFFFFGVASKMPHFGALVGYRLSTIELIQRLTVIGRIFSSFFLVHQRRIVVKTKIRKAEGSNSID